MKPNSTDHTVTEDAIRPARPDGTCFYCHAPLGAQHNQGCVMRTRPVVVDFTIRMVLKEPEDFDQAMIEFRYNESSWCGSNLIGLIQELESKRSCLCANVSAKFVREATPEDHEAYSLPA